MAPSVFVVAADFADAVARWLDQQDLASASRSGLFDCSVYGWAVADGGITYIDPCGFMSLPSRYRVVGWDCLRGLLDDLELTSPRGLLVGEQRYRYQLNNSETSKLVSPSTSAKLLTAYDDGRTLKWVVHRLLGDAGLSATRSSSDPAFGEWGNLGFTLGATEVLARYVSPHDAITLALRLEIDLLDTYSADRLFYGISPTEARAIVWLSRVDEATICKWKDAGVPLFDLEAIQGTGATPAEARDWLTSGSPPAPYLLPVLLRARKRPCDLAPYVALGIDVTLSYRLSERNVPVEAVDSLIRTGVEPMSAARSLAFDPA